MMSAAKALKAVPSYSFRSPSSSLLFSSPPPRPSGSFCSLPFSLWPTSPFAIAIAGNDALRRFLPEMALPRFVECLSAIAVQWTLDSQSSRTDRQAEPTSIGHKRLSPFLPPPQLLFPAQVGFDPLQRVSRAQAIERWAIRTDGPVTVGGVRVVRRRHAHPV